MVISLLEKRASPYIYGFDSEVFGCSGIIYGYGPNLSTQVNSEEHMAEQTLKLAYGILPNHAETLSNQQEVNIDDLLTIVTESVAS